MQVMCELFIHFSLNSFSLNSIQFNSIINTQIQNTNITNTNNKTQKCIEKWINENTHKHTNSPTIANDHTSDFLLYILFAIDSGAIQHTGPTPLPL
jgi:hypothetical protein